MQCCVQNNHGGRRMCDIRLKLNILTDGDIVNTKGMINILGDNTTSAKSVTDNFESDLRNDGVRKVT